jgi:hypothetical protein
MGAKKLALASILLALLGGAIFFQTHAKRRAFLEKERFIPFETSMERRNLPFIHKALEKKLRKDERWQKFFRLYKKNILQGNPSQTYRIPKIIHQI